MSRATFPLLGSTQPHIINPNPFRHVRLYSQPHHRLSAVHVSSSTVAMPDQPHPSFEISGGARGAFLPPLRTLLHPYNPFPLVGWNRHVETIFAAFFRSAPDVTLRRECLRTKDDGAVALDWVSGDDRTLPPESPLLILLVSNLFGSRENLYRKRRKIRYIYIYVYIFTLLI